ncbi:MAG: hypothetical protein ABIN20_09435 [candidate division WOR-3 bacterium]
MIKNKDSLLKEIEDFILNDIRPRIKMSPGIEDVIVWVKDVDNKKGTIQMGVALGDSTGCSPFCGCAARQITEIIFEELRKKFPQLKKAVGIAELPPEDYLKKWAEV